MTMNKSEIMHGLNAKTLMSQDEAHARRMKEPICSSVLS